MLRVTKPFKKEVRKLVQSNLIKAEAMRNGMSVADLARAIGVNPVTLYRKLRKGVLNSDEIEAIVEVCNIKDPMPIFFPKKLRKT